MVRKVGSVLTKDETNKKPNGDSTNEIEMSKLNGPQHSNSNGEDLELKSKQSS